jgi:hypothetical protein
MQNRAARIITGKSYEIRTSKFLKELNWQTLRKEGRAGDSHSCLMPKIRRHRKIWLICLDSLIMKNMTLEITELIFNWINLRLISSKKVLATQGQNAGIICQMRLRQKK